MNPTKLKNLSLFIVSFMLSLVMIAAHAELPYGPDTCRQGYVWREAFPDDHVCVTPDIRSQASNDNRQANARRQPRGGAYGPDTCRQGYVWREARPDDHVCVTPETRTQAAADNSQAATRREQSSTCNISGHLIDDSDLSIWSVIIRQGRNVSQSVAVASDGSYSFISIPQGTYHIYADTKGDLGWGFEDKTINCVGSLNNIDLRRR